MKIVMAEEFNGQLWVRADMLHVTIKEAVETEREACANVCEPQEKHDDPLTAFKIAEAIRARGNT